MIGSAIGSIGKASAKTAEAYRFPAPIKGIDQRQSISDGDLATCVYSYNLCPFEYGLRVRKGYSEWQIDVEDIEGNSSGVHTLIPYDSQTADSVNDRLFAVTNEGIWDVTVKGAAPILKLTFDNQDPNAGYGVYTHYVTSAAEDLLFYADNINGLYEYEPATDLWLRSPQFTFAGGTPPSPEDLKFVVSHKNRLWFVEANTATAWYLELASKKGEVNPFYFGSKFKHGGTLEGLFSWTVDGGAGVDDMLVAVSRSGDVIPYKGSDPETADGWEQVGVYFIGAIPIGPSFATEHGGELILLSTYGVIGMNALLKGVDSDAVQSNTENSSFSLKISGTLRDRLQTTLNDYGWSIRLIPSEGGILISTPLVPSAAYIQYYYNIALNGWSLWRDVPMTAFDTWRGEVVFGTSDNRVARMDVNTDNVLLTPVEGEPVGEDINFSVLTSFSSLGAPALYKKVQLLRPDFVANQAPTYVTTARYDFDITEALLTNDSLVNTQDRARWDDGQWDEAVWESGIVEAFNNINGGWGYGRYIAVATKGQSRAITRLIGWDAIYTVGGPLL